MTKAMLRGKTSALGGRFRLPPYPLRRRRPRVGGCVAYTHVANTAAAAAVAAGTALQFTPVHALCGGAILGIAAVGKMTLTGRILGVSGAVKGITQGDLAPWRFAFLGGLLAAGAALSLAAPGPAPPEPMVGAARAALAGLLVGLVRWCKLNP